MNNDRMSVDTVDPSKTKETVVDGKVVRQKVYYKVNDGYNREIDTTRTMNSFSSNLENLQYVLDEITREQNADYALDNMTQDEDWICEND